MTGVQGSIRPRIARFLWLLILVLSPLSLASTGVCCEPLARTSTFSVTDCDLARWQPVLERRRDLRSVLGNEETRLDRTLEEIALARILVADHLGLLTAREIETAWETLNQKNINKTYVREVLQPQVLVSVSEIKEHYEQSKGARNFDPVARVHEIFFWAPKDLPLLRTEKMDQAEKLATHITTLGEFKSAAKKYSDAPSAQSNGSLGNLHRSKLSPDLERIIFEGPLGLTKPVGTADGVYLFFVSSRKTTGPDLEDVASKIEGSIRSSRLAEIREKDLDALRVAYGLTGERESDSDSGLMGIPAESQRLPFQEVSRQERAMLYGQELEKLGLCPSDDWQEQLKSTLSRKIFANMVEQEWSRSDRDRAIEAALIHNPMNPGLERWTFSVMWAPKVDSPRLFFDLLRLRHELGKTRTIDGFAAAVESRLDVRTTIDSYDDVPMIDVAGLGPEIYNTIRYRLEIGVLSKPLVIPDRQNIAVVLLTARRDDHEANRISREKNAEAIARRLLAEQLRQNLLRENGYQRLP